MSDVIAYTIGSFWYCIPCVRALGQDDEAEATTADQLLDGENYYCDSCAVTIKRLA